MTPFEDMIEAEMTARATGYHKDDSGAGVIDENTRVKLAQGALTNAFIVLESLSLWAKKDDNFLSVDTLEPVTISDGPVSLVETADATSDICVVTKGSQATFGFSEGYINELDDMHAIKDFMKAMGQTVRETSVFSDSFNGTPLTDKERVLRGSLIFEETIELILKGFGLGLKDHRKTDSEGNTLVYTAADVKKFEIFCPSFLDNIVVDQYVLNNALKCVNRHARMIDYLHGIPSDKVIMEEVMRSNAEKLWEDGKPRYRESDGKVIKPPNWEEPNIARVLKEYADWDGTETVRFTY